MKNFSIDNNKLYVDVSAIEVLKDNLKQVKKAYKNFGSYSSAGIVIDKNLITALSEALLVLEQKEDYRKQGALEVVDDLKRIVSQNKSEQECYKDILSYIYKEGKEVKK